MEILTLESIYIYIGATVSVALGIYFSIIYIIRYAKSLHAYVTHPDGRYYTFDDPFESFGTLYKVTEFNPWIDMINMCVIGCCLAAFAFIWLPVVLIVAFVFTMRHIRNRYQDQEKMVATLKGSK